MPSDFIYILAEALENVSSQRIGNGLSDGQSGRKNYFCPAFNMDCQEIVNSHFALLRTVCNRPSACPTAISALTMYIVIFPTTASSLIHSSQQSKVRLSILLKNMNQGCD